MQLIAPDLELPLRNRRPESAARSGRETKPGGARPKKRSSRSICRSPRCCGQPCCDSAKKITCWLLNTHHTISDGWSIGCDVAELTALYEAFSAGQPSPLPELPVQYADYAVWQRQFLSGETLDKQLAYWKKQLAGTPSSLDLPTDRPRPPVQTYRGRAQSVVLPKSLLDSLEAQPPGRRDAVHDIAGGLRRFTLALSGQEDVVVGTPIAGRNRAEVEKLIGFFVNTLVMRTDLSGDPSFRELLARVRETAMGAYAHQDLPFEKLVEEVKPDRDLSRNPLFQVMLVLQNMPAAGQKLGDIETTPLGGTGVPNSQFDLTLNVAERPDGLRLMAVYNTDLFDATTIERMLRHLEMLLESGGG